MKIRKVSYFLALCEECSFTRAAKRCGIAQPTLTRAIRLLEQEIGGRLFERGSSSVRLTELGTLLLPDFIAISKAAENIRRRAASLATPDKETGDHSPVEAYARVLTVSAIMISILTAGVASLPTVRAEFEPDQARAQPTDRTFQHTRPVFAADARHSRLPWGQRA